MAFALVLDVFKDSIKSILAYRKHPVPGLPHKNVKCVGGDALTACDDAPFQRPITRETSIVGGICAKTWT